ncbi:hypothetical protein OHA44_18010 [Streptomyces sp. NBC_00144]|uniref:hypothetical protein n=1 Tax=Streptomyces sp. NBC_00144 TaxID=2975665 RepID=UPI003251D3FA
MTGDVLGRAVRAAMFAAVCLLCAVTGHVLMSGVPLPWWAVAGGFAGTAVGSWALARKERGITAVTSAAVGMQAALHAGFSLAQAATHPAMAGGSSFAREWSAFLLCGNTGDLSESAATRMVRAAGLGGHLRQPLPGMGHMDMPGAVVPGARSHVHHVMQTMTHGAGMPAGHRMGNMSPSGMLAAHLLAALLSGLWLAHGERAAFRTGRAVAGWLAAPLRPLVLATPVPVPGRPRICCGSEVRTPRQLLLSHVITSRGPPRGIAVI